MGQMTQLTINALEGEEGEGLHSHSPAKIASAIILSFSLPRN